jgi:nucleoside-diphosphate-sugar epimerase
MRIFITGATGFIGDPLVKELITAGYQVLGLARSKESAHALGKIGAEVQLGPIEDLETLRQGASASDAVIHLAFNHDFSKFRENCEIDKRAIEAIGIALRGSDRPLIVASGLAGLTAPGQVVTEAHDPSPDFSFPRVSEQTAFAMIPKGVRASVVRLPQVHNTVKQGLVTYTIEKARETGVSAYIGDGSNRWSAAHVSDVAHLFRLVLEKNEAGAKYHAVAEQGVSMREIAEAIGRGLKVPVKSISADEAPAHFGWLSAFAGLDLQASSAITRKKLGWNPSGPGLISDLEKMNYSLAQKSSAA